MARKRAAKRQPTDKQYADARAEAQAKADETGFDYGLEWNDVFGQFHIFGLPQVQNRFGHELRCEVVYPTLLERCQPGHGPMARGLNGNLGRND